MTLAKMMRTVTMRSAAHRYSNQRLTNGDFACMSSYLGKGNGGGVTQQLGPYPECLFRDSAATEATESDRFPPNATLCPGWPAAGLQTFPRALCKRVPRLYERILR